MQPQDMEYANLVKIIKSFTDKGRPVSIAFLNWFLEHIYRLDQVSAEDVICDKNNDRGIDGIYVYHEQLEVHVFQSKTKQNGAVGDKDLREFSGSLNQLRTKEALSAFLAGKVDQEIKDKIIKLNLPELFEKGYSIKGVFLTNAEIDANGLDVIKSDTALVGYDRNAIAQAFVDLGSEGGIKGDYEFKSDGKPLKYQAGDIASVTVLFVEGKQLAAMPGIADGTLFELNVRLPLGSTKVNKAIRESIEDLQSHKKFALFHNGVTILAENVEVDNDRVKIRNFVVVNGAQSLKQFYNESDNITTDLRVLARIIEIGANTDLAREISINSNNQNGIKPRDLRSNDQLQIRLQAEFEQLNYEGIQFDVKRGDESGDGAISNEYAAKLLLAFDLEEPWSCHQTYKLFDEKYAEIFGRPGVNAQRIIFLSKVMDLILSRTDEIENAPFAHYGITCFFLLAALKKLLSEDPVGRKLSQDPRPVFASGIMECVLKVVDDLLQSVIIDVNHEVKNGHMSDYKSDLKSRGSVEKLISELVRSYQKDKARGKVVDVGERLKACKFPT